MKFTETRKRLGLIILAFVIIFAGIPVFSRQATAIECDEGFYNDNNILFYNPCATDCSAATKTTVSIVTKLNGENNAEKVFNYWIDAGLTVQQAASITASIKNVSGFSAFYQEDSEEWPEGGWGIAAFTNDMPGKPLSPTDTTGQRDSATEYVLSAVTKTTFDEYYKANYGGVVLESNGFIPDSVNTGINDRFLLAELNYLLSYTRQMSLSSFPDRVTAYQQGTGQTVDTTKSFFDYFTSLTKPSDAATAWTYLYEYPANGSGLKEVAVSRASDTSEIIKLYGKGITTGCGGGLVEGGMTLEQAVEFMNVYKTSADSVNYIGGASRSCIGGPLANCVSFSAYFMNKYTELQGFKTGRGMTLVPNVAALNPDVETGKEPRPYAVFSYGTGSEDGHTGVILGVDLERGVVVVGDAGCKLSRSTPQAQIDRIHATEQPLSKYQNGQYTFIYTADILKEGIE